MMEGLQPAACARASFLLEAVKQSLLQFRLIIFQSSLVSLMRSHHASKRQHK